MWESSLPTCPQTPCVQKAPIRSPWRHHRDKARPLQPGKNQPQSRHNGRLHHTTQPRACHHDNKDSPVARQSAALWWPLWLWPREEGGVWSPPAPSPRQTPLNQVRRHPTSVPPASVPAISVPRQLVPSVSGGAIDGMPWCRMSILRNANVACLCRQIFPLSPVEFKKCQYRMSLYYLSQCCCRLGSCRPVKFKK